MALLRQPERRAVDRCGASFDEFVQPRRTARELAVVARARVRDAVQIGVGQRLRLALEREAERREQRLRAPERVDARVELRELAPRAAQLLGAARAFGQRRGALGAVAPEG